MTSNSPPPLPDLVLLISRKQRKYERAVNELIRAYRIGQMRVMLMGRTHFVRKMESLPDVVRVELEADPGYPL